MKDNYEDAKRFPVCGDDSAVETFELELTPRQPSEVRRRVVLRGFAVNEAVSKTCRIF